MNLTSKLDIVKGGIAKKDLTPILKHLQISRGWITSTNGRLTISTPIPEIPDLDIIVPADKFIAAMKTCKNPKFKITDTQRLSITDSKFRALLPLMQDITFPSPEITGAIIPNSDLLSVIEKLNQFIGIDASRPWACGILLYDNMAYVTNNVILAECPIEWSGPAINIPDFLVNELLRLKRKIKQIKTSGQTITLELEGSIWINSALLSIQWPNVKELFAKVNFEGVKEIPKELYSGIQDIIPFCADKKFPQIFFNEDGITTEEGTQQAAISIENLHPSVWRAEPLLNLLNTPKKSLLFCDFSLWPSPCPWIRDDGLKGLIIGLRQ